MTINWLLQRYHPYNLTFRLNHYFVHANDGNRFYLSPSGRPGDDQSIGYTLAREAAYWWLLRAKDNLRKA